MNKTPSQAFWRCKPDFYHDQAIKYQSAYHPACFKKEQKLSEQPTARAVVSKGNQPSFGKRRGEHYHSKNICEKRLAQFVEQRHLRFSPLPQQYPRVLGHLCGPCRGDTGRAWRQENQGGNRRCADTACGRRA